MLLLIYTWGNAETSKQYSQETIGVT